MSKDAYCHLLPHARRITSISVSAEVISLDLAGPQLATKFGADTHLGILSLAGRTMAV
jgi:hypothetical protein